MHVTCHFVSLICCRRHPRRRSKFPLFQATTTSKLTRGAVVRNHTKETHGLLGSWEAFLSIQFHGIMTWLDLQYDMLPWELNAKKGIYVYYCSASQLAMFDTVD